MLLQHNVIACTYMYSLEWGLGQCVAVGLGQCVAVGLGQCVAVGLGQCVAV